MQFFVEAPMGYYTLRVSKARKSKSEAQLGAIFGLMIERVIAFCDDNGWDTSAFLREMVRDDLPTGVAPSKDLIKDLLYDLCPIFNDDGKRITLSQSDTKQAAEFYTNCTTLLASRGIYVPDPDPNYGIHQKKTTGKRQDHTKSCRLMGNQEVGRADMGTPPWRNK